VPAPPTPADVYQSFGVDNSQYLQGVVRIPVAGPTPLNTLASFTLPVGNIGYRRENDPELVGRARTAYITGFTINGYDPGRPENQGLMHSCTATLTGAQTFDNAAFLAAVDAVGLADPQGGSPVEIKGWEVDEQGRFKLMVYEAVALDEDQATFLVNMLLRCWVLCHEPTPPPPETPEQLATRAGATFASQKLVAYQEYVTLPGADLWKASQEIADVARQLEAAAWADEAIEAHELTVKALRAYTPTSGQQLDYLIFFAGQRQNLIARLIERHRLREAAALGPETVAGYNDYYHALPETDREEVVRVQLDPDLIELQRQLFDAGLTAEPVEALQLLVAGFRASTPPTEMPDRLDFDIKFAEARHDLIARLIDDDRRPEAQTLVAETIDGYRQYASEPRANRALVIDDLTDLARLLLQAQLTTESEAAQQAANDLHLD
jgi:hypothetical protein